MVACISWTWIWLTIGIYLCGLSSHTASAKQTHPKSLVTIESICPARTINYITATLPQQCLRTDWTSAQISSATVDSSTSSSTNSPASTSVTVTDSDQDAESDPLSDNANFLSFEDWKAQMLKKSGQSPEHVAGSRMVKRKETRGGGINNALDGYGEEGELEIDFGGFPIPDVTTRAATSTSSVSESKASGGNKNQEKQVKKSKEAGTTSKQRFNYASFDCAATVLKTNAGSKGSTSILSENKDSYMINACSLRDKFVIVELCDDINIDTIVLGNFEFFSSTFRSFRVSVADRYPVKSDKWENLGTFEARNTRGIQAFLVENRRMWARYLRIEFLTHYGAEYYCPVSLLRVHGKTMIDDWKTEAKDSQGDDDADDDEETEEPVTVAASSIVDSKTISSEAPTQTPTETTQKQSESPPDYSFYDDKCPRVSLPGPLVEQTELLYSHCDFHRKFCNMAKVQRMKYTSIVYPDVRTITKDNSASQQSASKKEEVKIDTKSLQASHVRASSISKSTLQSDTATKTGRNSKTNTVTTSTKTTQQPSASSGSAKGSETRSPSAAKSSANAIASTVPQDSFFRSIHKRLQQLEANSTLSLQYIEEQSRNLREAFNKVEKRQLSKTSSFLETLNTTVLHELRQFKLQYDQIWQSTVLELSAQREQSQREVTALSQRLTLLADEILWQKRLAILQFALILLCLVLVVFSRHNSTGTPTFDLPLLQNMVSRSGLAKLARSSRPVIPLRPSSSASQMTRPWTPFLSAPDTNLSDDEAGLKANERLSSNGGEEDADADAAYQLPTPTSELANESLRSSPARGLEVVSALRHAQSAPDLGLETSIPSDEDGQEDGVSFDPVSGEDEEEDEEQEEEEGNTEDETEAHAEHATQYDE